MNSKSNYLELTLGTEEKIDINVDDNDNIHASNKMTSEWIERNQDEKIAGRPTRLRQ